jgi:hypothetical protein
MVIRINNFFNISYFNFYIDFIYETENIWDNWYKYGIILVYNVIKTRIMINTKNFMR